MYKNLLLTVLAAAIIVLIGALIFEVNVYAGVVFVSIVLLLAFADYDDY